MGNRSRLNRTYGCHFSPDPFPLSATAVRRTRHAVSDVRAWGEPWTALHSFGKRPFRAAASSHSFHNSRRTRLREKRAAGVSSKRGRKRMYRDENQVSTSISQWEHFLSRRGLQDRGKGDPGPCSMNENDRTPLRYGYGLKRNSRFCCRTRRYNLARDPLSPRSRNRTPRIPRAQTQQSIKFAQSY